MPVKPRPFRASACLRRYLNTKAWSVGLDFDVPEEATDSQALPSQRVVVLEVIGAGGGALEMNVTAFNFVPSFMSELCP